MGTAHGLYTTNNTRNGEELSRVELDLSHPARPDTVFCSFALEFFYGVQIGGMAVVSQVPQTSIPTRHQKEQTTYSIKQTFHLTLIIEYIHSQYRRTIPTNECTENDPQISIFPGRGALHKSVHIQVRASEFLHHLNDPSSPVCFFPQPDPPQFVFGTTTFKNQCLPFLFSFLSSFLNLLLLCGEARGTRTEKGRLAGSSVRVDDSLREKIARARGPRFLWGLFDRVCRDGGRWEMGDGRGGRG